MLRTLRTTITLTQFLIDQRRRFPNASGNFNALILDVAMACKAIAKSVAYGALAEMVGKYTTEVKVNVQGEAQKALDVVSNEIFIRMNEGTGLVAGMASEEMDEPHCIPQIGRAHV